MMTATGTAPACWHRNIGANGFCLDCGKLAAVNLDRPPDSKYADLKIARITNVKNLAASISKHIQQGRVVRMTSIGAGSVSQMMKACACTLQYLAPLGFEVRWKVYWADKPMPADITPQEGRRPTWSALVVESHLIH